MKSPPTKRSAFIVIGLGYGDEGKGLVTDYLCYSQKRPIVIRFNGGQQAGHTVVNKNGERHVFSNFGSGTLRNVPTYWSGYCTFSPTYFLEEYHSLNVKPKIFIDKSCPITTHYDILYNRAIEFTRKENRHGSCGLGFGATVERDNKVAIKFRVEDLSMPNICIDKLKVIKEYYRTKINNETDFAFSQFNHDLEDERFRETVEQINNFLAKGLIGLTTEKDIFSNNQEWESFIFEGAQGVLLDINFGDYPYTTKSNTTSKNAIEILSRHSDLIDVPYIVYVTRAYQTRHGAGPFRLCTPSLELRNIDDETNKYNDYQREFRISNLDIDKLNYAISCDEQYSKGLKKHLVVTCLDQLKTEKIPIFFENENRSVTKQELVKLLNCEFISTKFSFSNCTEDLK